jgi:integron integrase
LTSETTVDNHRQPLSARVRAAIRLRHLSPRTEEAYLMWIRRFHEAHGGRDPARLGADEVTAFLSRLATDDRVAASTQNQALAALLFLYRDVLGVDLPWLDGLVRARRPQRLPTVLGRDEVARLLGQMQGAPQMMATLLYGAGLRLMECCRLRVKDLDFERHQITVREGKGDKDRPAILPAALVPALRAHLAAWHAQHESDRRGGWGWVELPHALDRKLPGAGQTWPWQWVFPATRTYEHEDSGQRRRCHRRETVPRIAVHEAARGAGITGRAICQTLRHDCATHLHRGRHAIRTVQALLGQADVSTAMTCSQIPDRAAAIVRSPGRTRSRRVERLLTRRMIRLPGGGPAAWTRGVAPVLSIGDRVGFPGGEPGIGRLLGGARWAIEMGPRRTLVRRPESGGVRAPCYTGRLRSAFDRTAHWGRRRAEKRALALAGRGRGG